MLGIAGKFLVSSITLCKKIQINLKSIAQGLSKTQSTIIWLIRILRAKLTLQVISFHLLSFEYIKIRYVFSSTVEVGYGSMNKLDIQEK